MLTPAQPTPQEHARLAEENGALVENALDLLALIDASGCFVRVNPAAHSILGYAPGELVGMRCADLLHPDERAAVAAIDAQLGGGEPFRCNLEHRWLRKDGREVVMSMSLRRNPGDGLVYASGRDVTAHHAARAELARSREQLNSMLESIGDAFFALDRDWRITYANAKAASFVGVSVNGNIGRHVLEVAPDLSASAAIQHYQRAMATQQACFFETYWEPTGAWVEVRAYPTAQGLSVYFHDISARRLAAEALRVSEQRYRNLFQQAGDSIVICRADLHIVAVNGRACQIFGYTEQEFLRLTVSDIDGGFTYTPQMAAGMRAGRTQLLRLTKRRRDGSTFPAEVHVSRFDDGGTEYFQAIIRDLTEREESERQLRESEQRFREVIEMTPAGYLLAGEPGILREVNPALCALGGYSSDELQGAPLHALFPGLRWSELASRDGPSAVHGLEAALRHRNGFDIHVLVNASIERDAEGAVRSLTALMTDITGRKHAESRLQQLATHDTLTGLPNRALLNERLQDMLEACPRSASVAVMFLDLDRFKEVNDSFGHELGDSLLCEVAARLRKVIRPSDVIARLGGDEFVIAAHCASGNAAAASIAEKLLGILTAPIPVGGQDVIIGASIGISMFPTDAQTKESLFQSADTAMYRAKASGRNRYRFFEPEMTVAAQARMALEVSLRPALVRGEFELHYQPRVALRTMTVVGMEALIRWNHPELGRIPPQQFIAIAEETGIIVAIGRWVLNEACRHARRVIDELGQPLCVSVNVSARQLAQAGFVDEVRMALAESALPPECLELELTESALIEDIERTAAMLGELRSLGLKLAVDDFGTGYSGLAYLRRFPIDILKLDRSFVLQHDERISTFDFVKAFVDMAHALKLSVVAEGVETADVLEFLQATACDQAQGYLLSAPVPGHALAATLRGLANLAARAA